MVGNRKKMVFQIVSTRVLETPTEEMSLSKLGEMVKDREA